MAKPGERRLAAWRRYRGWTQVDMSRYTGIPQRTIAHMESQASGTRPNLRAYVQCALALECDLEDVVEPEWLEWQILDRRSPAPPGRDAFGSSLER